MIGDSSIYVYVRRIENLYKFSYTQISKYVRWSLSETIQTIYAYLNSKHLYGDSDSLGRDKPFFNIVNASRNIWYRATQIDQGDILVKPTDSKHVISAFLATQKIQEWMRKDRFDVYLSEWGLTLAAFGSAVSKFVEKKGMLDCKVIPWNMIICDSINFNQNPKIEILEYSPDELRSKKEYDQDMVKSLLSATMTRLTITGQIQDVKPDYIRVYEVHGMFPDSYLTGDEADKDEFSQQMHVISYVRVSDGKFKDFGLYKGKEEKDPYRIDHLLKEDGRVLAIGSVENLFQAQWMVNHTAKQIKDQLDLASKLMFQTSDASLVGQNALLNMDVGQIIQHKPNQPLTSVPNASHDIGSLMEYQNAWKAIGGEINGITDAMAGIVPKSSTSWKMQAMELQQAQMLFDLMKKNKEHAIEDMMRESIIPYVKKQLKTTKQIIAILEAHDITKIDSIYIPAEAIRRYNDKLISHIVKKGRMPKGLSMASEMAQVQSEQQGQGNVRYFKPSDIPDKTWKDIFADLEWEVEVSATGNSPATMAILSTLNTALQLVMNPAYATNRQAQLIVSKILTVSGQVSPLELSQVPPPAPQPVPSPMSPGAAPPSAVGAPSLSASGM